MAPSRSKPPPQNPTIKLPRQSAPSQAPRKNTMEVDTSWLETDGLKPPPLPQPKPPGFQSKATVREMPAAKRAIRQTVREMPAATSRESRDPRRESSEMEAVPSASAASGSTKKQPPPLEANAARHNTMQVEAQWLEDEEVDRKLRTSLAPLPPTDVTMKSKAKVTGLSREEPDEEPAPKRRSAPPKAKQSVRPSSVAKKSTPSVAPKPARKR